MDANSYAPMEHRFLVSHFILNPPPHVKILFPPQAKFSSTGPPVPLPTTQSQLEDVINVAAVQIPRQLVSPNLQDGPITAQKPFLWDLTLFARKGQRDTEKPKPSKLLPSLAKGWQLFAKHFPSRTVPLYAEELVRRNELLQTQKHNASRASTNFGTGAMRSSRSNSKMVVTLVRKRVDDSGEGCAPTVTLQGAAVCAKHQQPTMKDIQTYPTNVVIEPTPLVRYGSLEALEQNTRDFNQLVYDHILMASDFFLGADGRVMGKKVLQIYKPMLEVSDEGHRCAMKALPPGPLAEMVDCSPSFDDLKFDSVVLDIASTMTCDTWRRIRDHVSLGSLGEDDMVFGLHKCRAEQFLEVVDEIHARQGTEGDSRYPCIVSAFVVAGALQPLFFAIMDHTVAAVHDDEIAEVIDCLREKLKVPMEVMPFCKIHGLILANRLLLDRLGEQSETSSSSAEEGRYEGLQVSFFDMLCELLPSLQVDGLEDTPLTGFTAYKIFVFQEIVEATLSPLQVFQTNTNEDVCMSICRAFCATCTAVPPLFLSAFVRCDGKPLGCGKSVDSALMELLACFFGSSLLNDLGEPAQWIDTKRPLHEMIEVVAECSSQSSIFKKVFSQYIPAVDALGVPMFLRVASYVLHLYWGRYLEDQSSALPPNFVEGLGALFAALTKQGVREMVRQSIGDWLGWLGTLFERHESIAAEQLSRLRSSWTTGNISWGQEGSASVAFGDFTSLLTSVLYPLQYAVVGRYEEVAQRIAVLVVNNFQNLASAIASKLLLPTMEEVMQINPELFSMKPGHALNMTNFMNQFPLKIGLCRLSTIRGTKVRCPTAALPVAAEQAQVLCRLKYLHMLRQCLQEFVRSVTSIVSTLDSFVGPNKLGTQHHRDASGSSLLMTSSFPLQATLAPLVEELLKNTNRLASDLAEAIAIRLVYDASSPLCQAMQDRWFVTDMKYYRAFKYDKKFLLAEGKNGHIRPLYEDCNVSSILREAELQLTRVAEAADGEETILRIFAHMYTHVLAVATFILLDGGPERVFYPEQATDLLKQFDAMGRFFTRSADTGAPTMSQDEEDAVWSALTRKSDITSAKWWEPGNQILETIRTILSGSFATSTEELLNGTKTTPAYHEMKEISVESSFCRWLVRMLLTHRKDAAAKKFVKSIT